MESESILYRSSSKTGLTLLMLTLPDLVPMINLVNKDSNANKDSGSYSHKFLNPNIDPHHPLILFISFSHCSRLNTNFYQITSLVEDFNSNI